MRRRDFITLLGGTAAAWPLTARAQQARVMRRIGVFASLPEGDPESLRNIAMFAQGLASLGWTIGRNVQVDYRWGEGDADRVRRDAAELVAPAPDVLLAHGSTQLGPLLQATRSIPIVFVSVTDPVGGGFAASLARPGGNATGFMDFEYGLSGKWLELLKQVAPRVTRAAIIRDPTIPASIGQLGAIQSAAPSFGVELTPIDVRDAGEMERAVAGFARTPNGGLIVLANRLAALHRDLIAALAAQYRLPTVYPYRYYVASGGLMSYGANIPEQYRLAAGYVDRILKGELPGDLPVQAPTKYELVINLKAAKAIGLTIPESFLARADEVIE
jgi:putative tryptophan/tyrosine transport system substrate-binding protein